VILSSFPGYLDIPPLPPRSSGLTRRRPLRAQSTGRMRRPSCCREAFRIAAEVCECYTCAFWLPRSLVLVFCTDARRQRKDRIFAVAKGVEDVAIDRSLLKQAELDRKAK